MPDGDVLSSSVKHRWRSTLARIRGGGTPEDVAAHANRALAETLRVNSGVPGAVAYGAIVEARIRGELTPAEARTQARLVARSLEPLPSALLVLKAVERCIAEPVSTAATLGPGVLTVVEAVCHTVLDDEFFECVRPTLVGTTFADDDAYDRFIGDCRALLATGITRIADSVSRDPSAARLRAAPTRRRSRRPSTAAVLGTSLL